LRKRKLGCAALTVAILVLFFEVWLILATLFRLLHAGLTTLLALLMLPLTMLSRLTALLSLSGLVALLTLFFHIVCHGLLLLKRRLNCACEFIEKL
jgi:hypothetical protein